MTPGTMMALLALPVSFLAAATSPNGPATVVVIADKVVVSDVVRLGTNIDNPGSGRVWMKKPVQVNWEGVAYRQCHFGPFADEDGAATWFPMPENNWDRIVETFTEGTITILSGPHRGTVRTIKDVTTRPHKTKGKVTYFVYDRKAPACEPDTGFMVEALRLKRGVDPWGSKSNRVVVGDVPPGSFGCAAACLDGRKEKEGTARIDFPVLPYSWFAPPQGADLANGVWRVRFWAKEDLTPQHIGV